MQTVIQSDGQAALNVCGCGRLHFTYGPITLHFERDEFTTFASEVGRLASTLRQVADQRRPVLLPGRDGSACH